MVPNVKPVEPHNEKASGEPTVDMSKIETVDDLTKFEEELGKEDFEKEVYKYWTQRLGSNMGTGCGKNKAFSLSDQMFSRSFFTLFSWTGHSMSTDVNKLSLQTFKRTVNMFWKIVNNCDGTYSIDDNKDFLQRLMNKAKYRTEESPTGKRKRAATKNRPKNLKYIRKSKKEKQDDQQLNQVTEEKVDNSETNDEN